jgi:hypothetical protein
MKNSIKLTTLATYLLFAAIGAYIGMEYQALKGAADVQVLQEAGYVNKARSMPIAQFIDSGVSNGIY